MADYTCKAGDTRFALEAILKNPDGTVANLTGAAVAFLVRRARGDLVVDRAAVVDDAAAGSVLFAFFAAENSVPGRYRGEFVVTFSDARVATYPNRGYISIEFEPNLA